MTAMALPNDLFHLILFEFYNNNSVNRGHSIRQFVLDYFQNDNLPVIGHDEYTHVWEILKKMERLGFVRKDSFHDLERIKEGKDINPVFEFEGYNYVRNLIRDEKQDALNESFRIMNDKTIPNNNIRQLLLTCAIASAAIVSAVVAYKSYNDSPKKENIQIFEKSIKSLQDTLKLQGEELHNKIITDSIFQEMVKDSLKMK